jgi:hypothetical protein
MEISRAALISALSSEASAIGNASSPSPQELLEWSRLWNTISYYTKLFDTPEAASFHHQFVTRVIPQLPDKLGMEVSRGMSLHSSDPDFTVGGLLEEKYRYRVPELERMNGTE